ncbi:MAG: hypothetical protein OEY00_02420 [Gammaproteobacteria bacterium]|nr:hypothetical protein [Gammaproteobacteria bacterium]
MTFGPDKNNSHHKSILERCLCAGLAIFVCIYSSWAIAITPADQESDRQNHSETVVQGTLEDAQKAFKAKNYAESLTILSSLEGKYAGQIEFDYLLGRCALETSNFDLAISALIRVLTVDPAFAAGRFELARAYYSKGVRLLSKGPFEQARDQFKLVLQQNPPAKIKLAINKYQQHIDKYLEVREMKTRLFVELSGGYDSNVGSNSDDQYFSYYDYSSSSMKTYDVLRGTGKHDSSFGQVLAGIGIAMPLFSNNFELFGDASVSRKSYTDIHEYDHGADQVQFGARHYGVSNTKLARLRFKKIEAIDSGERYYNEFELKFEWALRLNRENALKTTFVGGDSNYDDYNASSMSINYSRLGVEWTYLTHNESKSSYQILGLVGGDQPHGCYSTGSTCNSIYLRDITGLRLAWSRNIFDQSRLYSSLYFQRSSYGNEAFYQRRNDNRVELFLGLNTPIGDTWFIRPEIHLINNDSSVDLYDFNRSVATVTIRWEQ